MYDPFFDAYFRISDSNAVSDERWWGGEPVYALFFFLSFFTLPLSSLLLFSAHHSDQNESCGTLLNFKERNQDAASGLVLKPRSKESGPLIGLSTTAP